MYWIVWQMLNALPIFEDEIGKDLVLRKHLDVVKSLGEISARQGISNPKFCSRYQLPPPHQTSPLSSLAPFLCVKSMHGCLAPSLSVLGAH